MFDNYQPAAHVLDRLKKVNLIAVVGPSGVGKTTLIHRAMEVDPKIKIVKTNTSRAPRPDETQDLDYHFRTREDMLARIKRGDFVQVAPSLFGDLYATAPEDYTTDGVAMMAILAEALSTFRALPFKSFGMVFIAPPSSTIWQERMSSHHFASNKLAPRLLEAKHSFEFALREPNMRFIINDKLDTATHDLMNFAHHSNSLTAPDKSDQEQARQIIQDILANFAWPV